MSFQSSILKHLGPSPFVIATLIVAACAHKPDVKDEEKKAAEAPKPVAVKTVEAAKEVASKNYIVVNFPAGRYALTETEKQKLAAWAVNVPKKGAVSEYEILAWADKEYPAEGSKVSSKEERLANNRAKTVKEFFKKDLVTKADLNTHNMAKRPGVFSEMFKTEDFDVKSTFENTGAAPTAANPSEMKIENKASKAVVLVKYQ